MATSAQGLLKAEIAYYDQHAKELRSTQSLRVDPRHPTDWPFREPLGSRGRGCPPVRTRPFPGSTNRRQADSAHCAGAVFGAAAVPTLNFHAKTTDQAGQPVAAPAEQRTL